MPPAVTEAACDKSYVVAQATMLYAEVAYPGRTAADLARVVALATDAPDTIFAPLPSGYQFRVVSTWVRDGAVAAYCGQGPAAPVAPLYSSIRFVGP